MPKLTVNSIEVEVEQGASVLQACEEAGFEIPRFCYHESLSVAGNCRICLIETDSSLKLVASCAQPILADMQIFSNTIKVLKARENIMESLLIIHFLLLYSFYLIFIHSFSLTYFLFIRSNFVLFYFIFLYSILF